MFKITVQPDQTFEAKVENGQLQLNQQPFNWDIQFLSTYSCHILKDNQSYNAEIIQADYLKKEFVIKINGTIYQLKAQDDLDLLLDKLGMSNGATAKIKEIKAPMPGLVLDIRVVPGQIVQKGDVLLILEAMKMENAIKSATDGVVKQVKAMKGRSVEKNQLLIVFE
jgi:biotin carboxyl carrier protein